MRPSVTITLIVVGTLLIIAPFVANHLYNEQVTQLAGKNMPFRSLADSKFLKAVSWIAGAAVLFVAIRFSMPQPKSGGKQETSKE